MNQIDFIHNLTKRSTAFQSAEYDDKCFSRLRDVTHMMKMTHTLIKLNILGFILLWKFTCVKTDEKCTKSTQPCER